MSTVVTVVSSKCRGVASLPGRTPCRKVGSGCPASFRLLLSCWVPGRALLESLGEQEGACVASAAGGHALLSGELAGAELCHGAHCCLLSRDYVLGERRGPGYLGLHSTSILGSGHPSLPEGALHSEACWLRALPCPGLLDDCFVGGSYLFSR